MLRNRRTGETWETKGIGLRKVNLFKYESSMESQKANHDLLEEFINDFKTRLPKSLSPKERETIIKNIEFVCKHHKEEVLMHSEKLLFMIEAKKQKESKKADHLSNLDNYAVPALLPLALAGAAALPASAAATIAQMASSYVIHGGIPTNPSYAGYDLCSYSLDACIQGYLTNGTQTWTADMPVFNRVLLQNPQDPQALKVGEVLGNCMDVIGTGNAVKNSITDTSAMGPMCEAQSEPWHSQILTSKVTGLTPESCTQYQNFFANSTQRCMDENALITHPPVKEISPWLWVAGGSACLGLVIGCFVGFRLLQKNKANVTHDDQAQPYVKMENP